MENWDPVAFKAFLRTTTQRLGQLQERKDSHGQLTRRDIATHLSDGHLALARAKAATLIQEDVMADLLEELEMLVGVVGSHVAELEGGGGVGLGLREEANEESGRAVRKLPRSLSPLLVEAAASIIHAAPSTESKDLNTVREILIQRLGPSFAQTVLGNRRDYVSPRIMQVLSSPPPTASKMDAYLASIAQTHSVKWVPEPRREDLLGVISEILRADATSSPIVDLARLREICARGLPDDPPWIRPRIWRLLFGTLPILKTTWAKETKKQRDSYYDLVRRLLTPVASLPPPTYPLSPTDALLTRISDSLFRVSSDLFVLLGNEPKSTLSGESPSDPAPPDIPCASYLDERLTLLRGDGHVPQTPEIRLESDLNSLDPALPSPRSSAETMASQDGRRPTTLLPSKVYNAPPAHRAHISTLLRLLYVHSTLNPAVQSPHVPWLLVPLYSALVGETDEDAVHAEADTFWVFEALVGEISEMEEEEGGKIWMRKLSERVKWADGELATSLHATGLDPVLPHYSYRWLAPLLAQTLPLSSVLPVWDVLFARPMRTRDVNPKLDYLVDICTALLVRARTPLFRLGKPKRDAPGLWAQEHGTLPPPSPLRPWELSDAFTEGIALLTSYPIDAAGGIDRILQTASDLAQRRIEERERERERERENVGFGARIKERMWKGFTNRVADEHPEGGERGEGEEEEEEGRDEGDEEENDEEETEEHDDGNDTETPAAPTLTSRFANTVWRGITNQSSMEDELPSPPSPSSAQPSPITPEDDNLETPIPPSQASLWDYAGKLKDSDTVAAFSKVSTNWRAKALDAWRVRSGSNASASSGPVAPEPTPPSSASDIAPRRSGWPSLSGIDSPNHRRESSPGIQRDQDPPRPAMFRSPRESFLPLPRRQNSTVPCSPNIDPAPRPQWASDTEVNASSLVHRAGASIVSLATFQPSHSASKSVPRPLMLSSRDLITKASQPQPPTARLESAGGQWGDIMLANKHRHVLKQESVSSVSSLSPSEALNRAVPPLPNPYARNAGTSAGPRSDYESDGSAASTSRRIALNRKSVSPMALASRSPNLPWNAPSPVGGRSSGHPLSNGSVTAENMETASEQGWQHVGEQAHSSVTGMTGAAALDSPTTIASPPIPRTPIMTAMSGPGVVRIANGWSNGVGGHAVTSSISTLSESSEVNAPVPLEPPSLSRHVVRKKTPPLPVPPAMPERDRDSRGDGHDKAMVLPSSESASSDAGAASLERIAVSKAPVKLRSKRYVPRPANLRLRAGTVQGTSEQWTPSPGYRSLAPECAGEHEPEMTPKRESYSSAIDVEDEEDLVAVVSRPSFGRKSSKEARLRREVRRTRDSSGAEEGDDEGYDDLLSAYESEEGSRE